MLCVETASATSLRNRYRVSSHNFCVTVGREVVAILRVNPILGYRDGTQPLVMRNSRYWPHFARSLLIRPIRTVTKTLPVLLVVDRLIGHVKQIELKHELC